MPRLHSKVDSLVVNGRRAEHRASTNGNSVNVKSVSKKLFTLAIYIER